MVTRTLTSSLLLPLVILFGSQSSFAGTEVFRPSLAKDTICPQGTEPEKEYILRLLDSARNSSDTAQRLVDTLFASKYVIKICIDSSRPSFFRPPAGPRAYYWQRRELGDTVVAHGKIGSGGNLTFNPECSWVVTTEGVRYDPVMCLLHELGHAWLANFGLLRSGVFYGVDYQEWQVTHLENVFRAAANKSLRLHYRVIREGRCPDNPYALQGKSPTLLYKNEWSIYLPGYNYLTRKYDEKMGAYIKRRQRKKVMY